jgi:glycosyltransferase involved in cell wall biosynthesis
MHADITPAVLTLNEAPNIGRMLERLRWAKDVVVVDSGSSDETVAIAKRFPNVRVFVRPFDSHHKQWGFAQKETGIRTEWMMRLDADYILSEPLIGELAALRPADDVSAYNTRFVYCIEGRPLRASLYPPRPRLFRVARGRFYQDGHADETAIDGRIDDLVHPIFHDDRKPLAYWIGSQARYMALESAKVAESNALSLPDWLRRETVLMPFIAFFYILFARGLILDGRAGLHYCLQRTLSEFMLKLYLVDRRVREP